MNRSLRYTLAIIVGAAVTGTVAFFEPPTDKSLILLVGIAQVYVIGTAIALRYESILRSTDGKNGRTACSLAFQPSAVSVS
ncbi:hypothetical protein [Haladaptatus sp. DFWS20]|uniref:hypothetical protein n=1 Tax=Haladaptatus sp. DFWS20 TaxID=3403467 RepID=UPI003EBCFE3F